MSLVHLHLLMNHVPVIGAAFGVLLLAFAMYRKSSELAKVGLGFFALLGAVSVLVFLTGEPAEGAVEKLPDFSKSIAEQHEEIALAATIAMGALGVLTLAALWRYRKLELPRGVAGAALFLALGVTGVMAYTANLGGQIRHTEIRAVGSGSTVARPAETEGERER